MPVRIDRVETEVDVRPPAAGGAAASGGGGLAGGVAGNDPRAVERLRPVVLQILREELERLRRQHG